MQRTFRLRHSVQLRVPSLMRFGVGWQAVFPELDSAMLRCRRDKIHLPSLPIVVNEISELGDRDLKGAKWFR